MALHFIFLSLPMSCELLEDWVLDSCTLSSRALLVPVGGLVHKVGWHPAGLWPCSASWVQDQHPQCPHVPYLGITVRKVMRQTPLLKTT